MPQDQHARVPSSARASKMTDRPWPSSPTKTGTSRSSTAWPSPRSIRAAASATWSWPQPGTKPSGTSASAAVANSRSVSLVAGLTTLILTHADIAPVVLPGLVPGCRSRGRPRSSSPRTSGLTRRRAGSAAGSRPGSSRPVSSRRTARSGTAPGAWSASRVSSPSSRGADLLARRGLPWLASALLACPGGRGRPSRAGCCPCARPSRASRLRRSRR
jgi:hypothetical protein